MQTKTVYNYDRDTGEYRGEAAAHENPRRPGSYLLPAFSTETAPPPVGEHEAAVYRDGAWSVVPDWRGHEYWLADGSRHEIIELGVEPPDGALDEEPPVPADARRKAAKDSIDLAAGKARDAFVSPGQYVAEEYRLAKQQVDEWIAAGKPANDVPPAVEVWAQARGWTAEQAAQDILDTEAAWMSALSAIREARLLGKAAVDAAPDEADFDIVAAPYIAQLEAIAEQAP